MITESEWLHQPWDHIDLSKVTVALLDIDGVLADTRHRDHYIRHQPKQWGPYFANMFGDVPWQQGQDLYADLRAARVDIIYLTGRNENYRPMTLDWLLRNDFGLQHELKMRPIHNHLPLPKFKAEVILWTQVDISVTDILVIDDDPAVVSAAEDLGTQTFQALWQPKEPSMVASRTS